MGLQNFDKILTWSDFPNQVAPGKPEDASISVIWRLDANQYERKGNAIVIGTYSVEIVLVDRFCAVVKAVANGDKAVADALLKHEQGHYDIIALGAREFYKKLMGLSAPTENELDQKREKIDAELTKKADEVDERYDKVTEHSKNAAVQAIWNKKIDAAKKNPNGTVADLL
ncbi:MAG: DUF922 domain-containing protein [Ginsengibacter sp.]